jgi:transcriptional regulator with XRE-family HTH domain
MTGTQVKAARKARGLTQTGLARHLGVSQGYVSLLERSRRPVPPDLSAKLATALDMPATFVPVKESGPLGAADARRLLGRLGYEGFGYLRTSRRMNPAEILLRTLRSETLDGRVVKALPWLLVEFPDLNWDWLVRQAKQEDLQNRLVFVVSLARALAHAKARPHAAAVLGKWEHQLEASRLLKTDTLTSVTEAEARWLAVHRSPEAKHWNVLSSLGAASMEHVN